MPAPSNIELFLSAIVLPDAIEVLEIIEAVSKRCRYTDVAARLI
jgi:hypothetical protein